MAWSAGPGELTSLDFGGTTVNGDLISNYSLDNTPESFDAAIGHSVDRGPVLKTLSADIFDVSAINPIHTLMTGRTETKVTISYADAATSDDQELSETIIRVTPLVQNFSDVCQGFWAASGTANDDLSTNFTDLGVTLDVPTVSFSFPFDGSDGKGRPYYSSAMMEVEFLLPADKYSVFTFGGQARIAFKLPDGNFQVMDGRSYHYYAPEDGSQPRAVSVTLRGVADAGGWGDLLEFTDGAVASSTEDFDASTPTFIQDRIHGINVEAVGFGYTESDVATFPTP